MNLTKHLLLFINFEKVTWKWYISKKNPLCNIFLYSLISINDIKMFLTLTWSFHLNSLIEITGIDLSKLNFKLFANNKNQNELLVNYNFFNYKYNIRYLFMNNLLNNRVSSVESVFKNASWLERELIEFFKVSVLNKKDSRNLLLDYNLQIYSFLKSFPVEGYTELYYNYTLDTISYVNSEFVEL